MKYKNPYSDSPNFVYFGEYKTDAFKGEYHTVDLYMLYDRSESVSYISFGMRHSDEGNDYWSGGFSLLHNNLDDAPWKKEMFSRFYDYLDTQLKREA